MGQDKYQECTYPILCVNFVERVLDVQRRHTDDGKAAAESAAPGESLEFLAQIRGWQSEERKKRKARLLQLNNIGLRVASGHAVGTDIFFIPKSHFAKETPEQGDEGWWFQVRSVLRCRECVDNVMSERKVLPTERMEEKATCHLRSVCSETASRAGVSAGKQKSEYRDTICQ
jgi:hypothetical protein